MGACLSSVEKISNNSNEKLTTWPPKELSSVQQSQLELTTSNGDDFAELAEKLKNPDESENILNNIEQVFKYFHKMRVTKQNLVDEEITNFIFSSNFRLLNKGDLFRRSFRKSSSLESYCFYLVLAELLEFCMADCIEYTLDLNPLQKKRFDLVQGVLNVSWYCSEVSFKFLVNFHESNAVAILLKYLSSEIFVRQCLKRKNEFTDANGMFILKSLLHSLHNLSKLTDLTRKDWAREQGGKKLTAFYYKVLEFDDLATLTFMTWANVISEEEMEKIGMVGQTISNSISKHLATAVDSIKTKEHLIRIKIHIDATSAVEAACVFINGAYEYNIVELIEAIYRLSVNDMLKMKLYKEMNLERLLKDVILFGNEYEKEKATKLLWQLCFNDGVMESVSEDFELIAYMNEFLSRKDSALEHEGSKRNIKGILWMNDQVKRRKMKRGGIYQRNSFRKQIAFKRKKSKQVDLFDENPCGTKIIEALSIECEEKLPNVENMHIMISYNKESRELCLRIKKELEASGHRVWIDVEHISGSSLASMADAVENAKCVLICMTEKYKQSTNCRAEAEYTFNLKKPIVPLIMQNDWTPDGWLGMILGTRIFVHFGRLPYDECIRKLKFEIQNQIGQSFSETVANVSSNPNDNDQKVTPKKWTNEDVRNWLKQKQVCSRIEKELKNFDGQDLAQLYNIYKTSPNYFFLTLDKKHNVELHSLIRFVSEIEKLFQ